MLTNKGRVNKHPLRYVIFLLIVGLFVGVFYLHLRLDNMGIKPDSMQVYMYIPSGKFLKPFALGFNQLIADYFWIKTVSYFGDHFMSDRKYPQLYHLLDLVTTLDPFFKWPYYFGGIILSLEAHEVEQSNLILKKAMYYHPDSWRFPFYLGFNYWFHYGNSLKAAAYIEMAARIPGSPKYLKTFPATLYGESGRVEAALQFLKEIEKNTQDQRLRAEILKRIEDIKKGKVKKSKKAL